MDVFAEISVWYYMITVLFICYYLYPEISKKLFIDIGKSYEEYDELEVQASIQSFSMTLNIMLYLLLGCVHVFNSKWNFAGGGLVEIAFFAVLALQPMIIFNGLYGLCKTQGVRYRKTDMLSFALVDYKINLIELIFFLCFYVFSLISLLDGGYLKSGLIDPQSFTWRAVLLPLGICLMMTRSWALKSSLDTQEE